MAIAVVVTGICAAFLTILANLPLRVTGRTRPGAGAAAMASSGATTAEEACSVEPRGGGVFGGLDLARDVEVGESSGDAGTSAKARTLEDLARATFDSDAESDANSHLLVLRSELGAERQVTAQQLVFGEGIGEVGTLITLVS